MRQVPQLNLGGLPQAPPPKQGGGFSFCPSPRKVNVRQEAKPQIEAQAQHVEAGATGKPKIKIVTEEMPLNYEPSQEEIEEYALWLGMDIRAEQHLLWIARQALKSPCPEPWKPCLTEDSEVFYFNFRTGESVWDHPVDVHSKKLYLDQKAKIEAGTSTGVPSLCLSLPAGQPPPSARGEPGVGGGGGALPLCSPRKLTSRARPKEETSIEHLAAELTQGTLGAAVAEAGAVQAAATPSSQARQRMKVTIMEEDMDPLYEPTDADIEEYAAWLGMDLVAERHLFWIAKAGLKERCPEPWKPCKLEDDELFYFNFATGESIWDHPCDRIYQDLYKKHKVG